MKEPADAEAVAAVVEQCGGVARLSPGAPVEVATYLPGRTVHGVRIDGRTVEVHIVVEPDVDVPQVAEEVRKAISGVVDGRLIDIYVDDIELEPASPRSEA